MMTKSSTGFLNLRDTLLDSRSIESLQRDASSVVSRIRPQWRNHVYKLFTDGITNKLIGVHSGEDPSDMILLRVYGKGSEVLIDRDSELNTISKLHSLDLSAPIYAVYGNGFAYGYTPGRTLDKNTVRDPSIYPLVIQRLATLHKVAIQCPSSSSMKSRIWDKLSDMLKLLPDSQSLREEVRLCQEHFESLAHIPHINSIVLCHNDLLLGNIIHDEEKGGSVSFIDFEYVFENYQLYDVANHFCEFVGLSEPIDYERDLPKEGFQREWIARYLKEMSSEEEPEDVLELALALVQKYMMLSHLFWGIWSRVQARISSIDFEFEAYGNIRLNEYYKEKRKYFPA